MPPLTLACVVLPRSYADCGADIAVALQLHAEHEQRHRDRCRPVPPSPQHAGRQHRRRVTARDAAIASDLCRASLGQRARLARAKLLSLARPVTLKLDPLARGPTRHAALRAARRAIPIDIGIWLALRVGLARRVILYDGVCALFGHSGGARRGRQPRKPAPASPILPRRTFRCPPPRRMLPRP